MSASLVGSEMCIRDSSNRHERGNNIVSSRGASVPPDPPKRLRRARGSISVSYTHLTLPTICSV
eukprot:11539661-Alexandrium_andersonii.AAC.1